MIIPCLVVLSFSYGEDDIIKEIGAWNLDDSPTTVTTPPAFTVQDFDYFLKDNASVYEFIQMVQDNNFDINQIKTIYGDMRPLNRLARAGKARLASKLIEAGADVNGVDGNGWTPLFDAILSKSVETVIMLVEAGAYLNVRDKRGRTPIDLVLTNSVAPSIKQYLASLDPQIQAKIYPKMPADKNFIPISTK